MADRLRSLDGQSDAHGIGGGGPYGIGRPCLWNIYLESAELKDILDAVTIAYQVTEKRSCLERVAAILLEENVCYRIDETGVMHFSVDEEFAHSLSSTIAGLDGPRYENVRAAHVRLQLELNRQPPDGKLAIRAAFDAVEALFKLMFPRAPRLGGNEVNTHLMSLVMLAAEEGAEKRATARWLSSFKEWIEACHFYRHEQGQPEPHQPPIDLAIALVSGGASYLRWLATYDHPIASSDQRERSGAKDP